MRATRPGNWPRHWATPRWCRRARIDAPLGRTTESGTRAYHAIERLFRRLKGVRRIFSRFNQLDARSFGFIQFARIVEALRECEQALA